MGRTRVPDLNSLMDRIRCVQFDPINHVARTQLLVLHARLGRTFDPADLDRALFEDRSLFHYWAHAASFVLTDDYPLHRYHMDQWPGEGDWATRIHTFLDANRDARREILRQLKTNGVMRSKDFEGLSLKGWTSSGWTEGQTITRMLDFMWTNGEIMIAGRRGLERLWARSDDWFPKEVFRDRLSEEQALDRATALACRAIGIGTEKQIRGHFVAGIMAGTRGIVARLVERGELIPFEIKGLPEQWYVHRDNLPLLDTTGTGWRGRTELLSPFDNLIRDRARDVMLFDFDYTIEIYVPKAKRRFGYYVLPILDGDRIVGRVDSKMDRKTRCLRGRQRLRRTSRGGTIGGGGPGQASPRTSRQVARSDDDDLRCSARRMGPRLRGLRDNVPGMEPLTFTSTPGELDWSALKDDLKADDFDNLRTPAELEASFANSHASCFAWDEHHCIGTARVISDGVCNAYLIDVWTHSSYRRRRIASDMVDRLLLTIPGQHVALFTENAESLYRSLGFQREEVGMSKVVGKWLGRHEPPSALEQEGV